ncbi:uncharacterized protein [Argopecten irradians]|uniref:uncharacterized protein n=1 Tax=Argopecten irradians TaxID=31199 RepID=UPI003716F73C
MAEGLYILDTDARQRGDNSCSSRIETETIYSNSGRGDENSQQNVGYHSPERRGIESRFRGTRRPESTVQFIDRNDNRAGSPPHFRQSRQTVTARHSTVVKPPRYNGEEDFEEYLTQFEIIAQINKWDYQEKSLYLASSLGSSARTVLTELSTHERQDFDSLVALLQVRYGSIERSEMYRARLQTRVRGKNESLSEVAQSIRKLTRQAYPTADENLTSILALDHFIDALQDSEMRLRVRELRPKTINEAETHAIRLEAHRLADRQRGKTVHQVCQEELLNIPVNQVQFRDADHTEGEQVDIGTLTRSILGLERATKQLTQTIKSPSPDTGANVSILSQSFIESFSSKEKVEISPIKLNLVTATGERKPFLGKCKLNIELGDMELEQEFLIADIKQNGIIGLDFMAAHSVDILLNKNCLTIKGKHVQCFRFQDGTEFTCSRVCISEDVNIPPNSEIIVPGRFVDPICRDTTAILEPTPGFVQSHEVMLAKSVVNPTLGCVPLRFLNTCDTVYKLHKDSIVATIDVVDFCQDLPPEELSVNEVKKEIPTHNTETSLPEHLEKLFDESRTDLTDSQSNAFKGLLLEYQDTFSNSSNDLGLTTLVEHTINTGSSLPIRQYPRRIPIANRKEVEQEIEDMIEKGVIEKSDSPWCSPVVLVRKKDNSLRFCIDYRKVNDVTIKDSHPLPRIDSTIDALSGSQWFSTLDLKSGYWQVRVAPEDRPKTAFSVQGGGLWQFVTMPFGLCNAPATFERLMEKVLAKLSWQIYESFIFGTCGQQ